MSIEAAISYRRRLLLLVPGCGTCTAETRVENAVRAVQKMLLSPPLLRPPTAAGAFACMTFPKQLG